MYLPRVGDVMTVDVVTVGVDTPFQSIVETMARYQIGAVPVVDQRRLLVGIVSRTDLLPKVELGREAGEWPLFEGKHRRLRRIRAAGDTARGLMSEPVVSVPADSTVRAAARLMDRAVLTWSPQPASPGSSSMSRIRGWPASG